MHCTLQLGLIMPINKKTGKKVPYTKVNVKKAKAGKGGLKMAKKKSSKKMIRPGY